MKIWIYDDDKNILNQIKNIIIQHFSNIEVKCFTSSIEIKNQNIQPDTITISTDKFSLYYLVYNDKSNTQVEQTITPVENHTKSDAIKKAPQTGNQTNAMLYSFGMITMLILGCFIYRKVKE